MKLKTAFNNFMCNTKLFTILSIITFLISGCASTPQDETYDWTAQKFFDEGKLEIEKNNFELALKRFSQLEAKFPYGKLSQQAQLQSVYVHYRNSEPEAAIAAADRFIKLNPRHTDVDYAYYMRGVASYNLTGNKLEEWMGEDRAERDPQQSRESFAYFKELITRFPNTKYRDDAIERMSNIRNSLAEYEIAVANYYFRRGAYIATVNRAKYVIENYPKSPSIPKALELLQLGYQKLEMDELAKDTKAVIKLNKK